MPRSDRVHPGSGRHAWKLDLAPHMERRRSGGHVRRYLCLLLGWFECLSVVSLSLQFFSLFSFSLSFIHYSFSSSL
jgi:hypothetical protein